MKNKYTAIVGYAYKWDNPFGATNQKLNRDAVRKEIEATQEHPLPVMLDGLDNSGMISFDHAIGEATLTEDDIGIKAHINLYHNERSRGIVSQSDTFIKENCNIGLGISGNMSFFQSDGLIDVIFKIVQFGRFLSPNIYTPETVVSGINRG